MALDLDKVYKEVAEELGLPKNKVRNIYKAYWKAIRMHIASMPLKEDLSKEEFDKLQPNVNIQSIGKLFVNYERYKAIKDKYKNFKEKQDAAHKED